MHAVHGVRVHRRGIDECLIGAEFAFWAWSELIVRPTIPRSRRGWKSLQMLDLQTLSCHRCNQYVNRNSLSVFHSVFHRVFHRVFHSVFHSATFPTNIVLRQQ